MAITSHKEDLLPEIQSTVPVDLAAQVAALEPSEAECNEGIQRDISGCFSLIGPVAVCFSVNTNIPSASIALKVGPVVVVSGEISPQHPCLTLKGNYGVAKWDLNICLRIPQQAITLEGKACVTLLGCKSFNITLFRWGGEEDLDTLGYPAYQCFKTQDRQVYCSSFKVKNHATGNAWIKAATTRFNVRVFGKPYLSDRIPGGAITYPNAMTGDVPAAGDDVETLGSTRISVTNSSDVTICAQIQLGAIYGAIALNPGEEGQMPCEWVWYTTDCFLHGGGRMLAQLTGVYGGKNLVLTGKSGDYKLGYKP